MTRTFPRTVPSVGRVIAEFGPAHIDRDECDGSVHIGYSSVFEQVSISTLVRFEESEIEAVGDVSPQTAREIASSLQEAALLAEREGGEQS